MKIAEYSLLNDLFEEAFETGDIVLALRYCNDIVRLIEDGTLPKSLLPYQKYEAGLLNAAIDNDEEAVKALESVVDMLKTSNRREHQWLANESKNALAMLKEFTSNSDYELMRWEEESPAVTTRIA